MGRFKFGLASLNCDGWRGLALAAACAALLLPEAAGEGASALLRYERVAIHIGQWWRLLTAHFVHLSLEHAVLNVLGLSFMWALFARDYRPGQWLGIVAGSIVAIDAGLWWLSPGVSWYVGASGVLHGVMAAGAVAHLRRGDPDGWILMAFLVAKLGYEQLAGAMPLSAGMGSVIVNAHLYGAAAGLTLALPWRARRPL